MSTQHREGVNEMVATEKLVKAGAAGRVGSLVDLFDRERALNRTVFVVFEIVKLRHINAGDPRELADDLCPLPAARLRDLHQRGDLKRDLFTIADDEGIEERRDGLGRIGAFAAAN